MQVWFITSDSLTDVNFCNLINVLYAVVMRKRSYGAGSSCRSERT
jgi:hypothetical protein